jgi:hypothetical protein
VYWSEWHNDPPRCCDPCNRRGQWVGPGAGSGGYGGNGYYSSNRPTGAHGGTTFAAGERPKRTKAGSSIARTTPNPSTKPRTGRRPLQGANQQIQR